jgi:hypothetical protein
MALFISDAVKSQLAEPSRALFRHGARIEIVADASAAAV